MLNPEGFIKQKPFSSFFEKSWRLNVAQNERWPDGPNNAIDPDPRNRWYHPGNWYSNIDDICRCTVPVKYLDGVEFLKDELCRFGDTTRGGITSGGHLIAKADGYYGAQVDFTTPMVVNRPAQVPLSVGAVHLEIQVTTELKTVVQELLHLTYEDARVLLVHALPERRIVLAGRNYHGDCLGLKSSPVELPDSVASGHTNAKCVVCVGSFNEVAKDWRWAFEGREFKVNYLGHIAHYLESAMVSARKDGEHHGRKGNSLISR